MQRKNRKIIKIMIITAQGVGSIEVGRNGIARIEWDYIQISNDGIINVYRAYDNNNLLVREISASAPLDITYTDNE